MREHSSPTAAERVFVGTWNAVKKYPEWWGKQTLSLYDRLRFPKYTPEEQKVDDRVHAFLKKNRNAIGWAETGIQAVVLSLAVRKGYQWLKNRTALPSPVSVVDHVPFVEPPAETHRIATHMVGADRVVHATIPLIPIEQSGLETMRVPAHLYHKGILVPVDAAPIDPVHHDPELWKRVLEMDPDHPEKAKGLIIASAHHIPVAFAERAPYVVQQLRAVNRALRGLRGDYMEHLVLGPLLPREDVILTDPTHYKRALELLEKGFEKHAKKWSILRPDVAFGYWASTYFPFLHVARNAAIERPGNHAAMWGLKLAYNRYGWTL